LAIKVKSAPEIATMRQAGRIVALTLLELRERIRPGVTTGQLDEIAEHLAVSMGSRPAFKGYRGFPASLCASVNDEVVHGIPSPNRVLEDGDVVSLDFGVVYRGFVGDAAITVGVGDIDPTAEHLLEDTRAALHEGVRHARAGGHLSDVSHAIEQFAEERGYSVVRQYVGHGIGRRMHEDPQIPNFGPPHQ
jgi:methionyl aminopeptidase